MSFSILYRIVGSVTLEDPLDREMLYKLSVSSIGSWGL